MSSVTRKQAGEKWNQFHAPDSSILDTYQGDWGYEHWVVHFDGVEERVGIEKTRWSVKIFFVYTEVCIHHGVLLR